ncbi:Decaprenyl diphosphate synthase-like protein [Catenaria anguillulae PL171]|uniref:Alkyl transferase n=1 Tax=Catenaria anguillulae PL171 TaxID=765915 RepID=A0A1Y2HYZ9_9FUNG|nr:Decaprenyl diphosphate synthase-like protein [Catenaria anguillulae PL171]
MASPPPSSSWSSWLSSTLQHSLISALALGPIPPHVAFIMDGNRRYAKRQNQPKQVALPLLASRPGVRVVTIYAFSIENFKRDQDEVDYLFAMMIDKLQVLSTESKLVERYRIRIRILGDVTLLPVDVQRAAYEAERRTSGYCGAVLNICIPYTSRFDMSHAVRTRDEMYDLQGITRSVEQALQTSECPPVDILVRTSGEHRLSDFLMWQVCGDGGKSHDAGALLEFVAKSWPEFSFWQFLPTLVDYQVSVLGQQRARKSFQFPNGLPWDPTRFDLAAIQSPDSFSPPSSLPDSRVGDDAFSGPVSHQQVVIPPSL